MTTKILVSKKPAGSNLFIDTEPTNLGLGSSNNIALGNQSGNLLVDGYRNILIGRNAGNSITDGYQCVCIGDDTDCLATTADGIAIGYLAKATTQSISIGRDSGTNVSGADYNIAIGNTSLNSISSSAAQYNVGVGFSAGTNVTTGQRNTILNNAGAALTTGSNNFIAGYGANVGSAAVTNAVAIGNTAEVTGDNGVAIGINSDAVLDSVGIGNTAQSVATNSVAVGISATVSAPSTNSIAIGASSSCTSTSCISAGYQAECTAQNSVALGNSALGGAVQSISIGSNSSATGTGYAIAIGSTASAINNSIAIGESTVSRGSGNTIGYASTCGVYTGVNMLGQSLTATVSNYCYIQQIFGGGSGGSAVYVNSSGQVGTVVSSELYKKNIVDLPNSIDAVLQLRPVEFQWDMPYDLLADNSFGQGLIAEEVMPLIPELCVIENEQPTSVRYELLPVYLLQVIKNQQATIDSMLARLDILEQV